MTTYIKLEEVMDEIGAYIEDGYEDEVRRLLNSLTSINPAETIEEMIKTDWFSVNGVAFINSEKLLQKFKS